MRGLKVVRGKERERRRDGIVSIGSYIINQLTHCMYVWHMTSRFWFCDIITQYNHMLFHLIHSKSSTYIGVYIHLLPPVTPTCHRMKRWTFYHTSPPYTLANGRFVCYNFLHVTVIVIISRCRLVFVVHHFPLYGSIFLVSKPYIK